MAKVIRTVIETPEFPKTCWGCGVCVGFGSSAGLIYVVNISCLDWDKNDEYES